MAADGAWPQDAIAPSFSGDEPARRVLAELRTLLTRLEAGLVQPTGPTLSPSAAGELAAALDLLCRRLERTEDAAARRFSELSDLLVVLSARVERHATENADLAARLAASERRAAAWRASTELALAVTPTESALVRGMMMAACAAGAASIVAAAVSVLLHSAASTPPVASQARPSAPPIEAVLDGLRLRPGLSPVAGATPSQGTSAPIAPPATTPGVRDDDYAAVARALERGEGQALPRLVGLAERGEPSAQLHLARIYESGAAGAPRDLGAARAWTRRAAEGGDRVAMHNLALFLANGEGGPADTNEAARWFRKAADLGVVDSQHNLGLLYEAGRGVPKNLREAYRWFSIAANAGDGASREKAVELEARLAPHEQASVARDAAGFRPGAAAPERGAIIPPTVSLAETAALLARAGYYIGPTDGAPSPALEAAAAAYRRDHPDARN